MFIFWSFIRKVPHPVSLYVATVLAEQMPYKGHCKYLCLQYLNALPKIEMKHSKIESSRIRFVYIIDCELVVCHSQRYLIPVRRTHRGRTVFGKLVIRG